jgi:hypothetical protein
MTLLINGDFEQGLAIGEDRHKVIVIKEGATNGPSLIQQPNMHNPLGWTPWFLHDPGTWDQPEGHPIAEPLRVQSGTWAYHLFAFCRKMRAGILQQVEITTPGYVILQGYAHAWSNQDGHENSDNPFWSEGPGLGPGYRIAPDPDQGVPPVWWT